MGEYPKGMVIICQVSSRTEFPKSCPLLANQSTLSTSLSPRQCAPWSPFQITPLDPTPSRDMDDAKVVENALLDLELARGRFFFNLRLNGKSDGWWTVAHGL
ncbi:hypothetical protein AVEN_218772-1 [Araneus ventricosus]|uniref:Uncharacterized protein n=1 Tax=Araneus ventricosus TaxID=182803 RepID=A0A4Y2B5L0_ARAVE|nr:hypothetical protein AVEN_218772-1 [Araneus ventricosus]